ncbi:olfactomedin-like protein 2A [Microplitis mediator]|uniref:olfactomedin-like protein 2A n=1 Tax=Microplitis mediator TaxID=375433 RepID=UPI00255229FD|nr:olfactomedin-like protein 2A [Microplitis mediator]
MFRRGRCFHRDRGDPASRGRQEAASTSIIRGRDEAASAAVVRGQQEAASEKEQSRLEFSRAGRRVVGPRQSVFGRLGPSVSGELPPYPSHTTEFRACRAPTTTTITATSTPTTTTTITSTTTTATTSVTRKSTTAAKTTTQPTVQTTTRKPPPSPKSFSALRTTPADDVLAAERKRKANQKRRELRKTKLLKLAMGEEPVRNPEAVQKLWLHTAGPEEFKKWEQEGRPKLRVASEPGTFPEE